MAMSMSKLVLRLAPDLHQRLRSAANGNMRSVNAEINYRLRANLEADSSFADLSPDEQMVIACYRNLAEPHRRAALINLISWDR